MVGYENAVKLFPESLQSVLLSVDRRLWPRVQEIRLREGQAVAVGIGGQVWYIRRDGVLSERTDGYPCEASVLQQVIDRLVSYSIYAHDDQLRLGFLTARGCRVGIAGTAVTERGMVTGYRHIQSVCVRVSREHRGCADRVAHVLCDGVHSGLIYGEPSGGKTSLLRDLAAAFAQRRIPVTVVDERGELGRCEGCDVLVGTPKSYGILQAVRCLAPCAVLVDELGDGDELEAVREAALRGVPIIATVHCRTPLELCRRGGIRGLLEDNVFDYMIGLDGRRTPGSVSRILRVEEWWYEMDRRTVGMCNGTGDRYGVAPPTGETYCLSHLCGNVD